MEAVAIVTVLALMQTFYFAVQVGQARVKHEIDAPTTAGNTEFECVYRVHQNTLEQIVLFVPALWIFGNFVHWLAAAGLGLLFIIARFVYRAAYINNPSSRSLGFGLGALSMAVLMLGGLIGAAMSYIAT